MKKFIFFSFLFISISAISQNDLWPNEEINTGSNSTYLVQNVTFNDQEFLYGKLGAFYTDDNGDLQNGGWILWNNTSNNCSVQGDDSTTPEKDGFADGEEITWLATNDGGTTTYTATVAYTMGPAGMGTSNFVRNGVNVMASFSITNCLNDANGNGICDEFEVFGCTDPLAFNYDSIATTDNGTCIEIVYGCTDDIYSEYNELANTDDGSCYTMFEACPYSDFIEYYPNYTIADASLCQTLIVEGQITSAS